jgi:indole-3-glycerol phosphate synthase
MASFLETILASRRKAVELDKARTRVGDGPPLRDFRKALAGPSVSLIAEIKRASPSRGDLNASLDPADLARAYERGGADALSVLVEPSFFKGDGEDLQRAREATSLPVLWKDFVIDPFQVALARTCGADAVLVIVRILPDDELVEMLDEIRGRGMCALVEVFDESDVERALDAGAEVIGVNHRDLETFEEDPMATARLRPRVPDGVLVVAESAISTRADVEALEDLGVHAMLVGEALVTSKDPAEKIRELLGA